MKPSSFRTNRWRDAVLLGIGVVGGAGGALLWNGEKTAANKVAEPIVTTAPANLLAARTVTKPKTSAPSQPALPDPALAKKAAPVVAVSRESRIGERIEVLRQRLGLSDAQADAARALLNELAPSSEELAEMATAEGTDAEARQWHWASESRKRAALFDDKLTKGLSQEQETAWRTFQKERESDQMEAAANQTLARLQSQMTLSGEQKDALFGALTQEFAADLQAPVEAQLGEGMADLRRVALADALQGVLSADQIALLQSLPEVLEPPSAAPLFEFSELIPN